MSTHSAIAIKSPRGCYLAIYCHWDGYLDGVGKGLLKHAQTTEEAMKLVQEGDHVSIMETGTESFRSRGEETIEPTKILLADELTSFAEEECGAKYLYIFDEKTERWLFRERNENGWTEALDLSNYIWASEGLALTNNA